MKLADLDPKLAANVLSFDCPCGAGHKIRVPIGAQLPNRSAGEVWQASGEFPASFTITPSIDAGCWHGHVTDGEITP